MELTAISADIAILFDVIITLATLTTGFHFGRFIVRNWFRNANSDGSKPSEPQDNKFCRQQDKFWR